MKKARRLCIALSWKGFEGRVLNGITDSEMERKMFLPLSVLLC